MMLNFVHCCQLQAQQGFSFLSFEFAGGVGGGALTIATTHHSLMTSLKFEDPQVPTNPCTRSVLEKSHYENLCR